MIFDKDNFHHAYVIEGNTNQALSEIREFVSEELGMELHGNIDLIERIYDGFGINDAREIKDLVIQRPIGKYKIFVLVIPSMTSASGNALLKSLEEPPAGTHFFIVVPNSKRLLHTLLSRVVLLKIEDKSNSENEIKTNPEIFLKSSKTKRLEEVKKILDLYDKERVSKIEVISFFKDVLEEYKNKKDFDRQALRDSVKSLDYMSDQSSSMKVLMEYISLVL